jgi:ribosomal protein S18 acetylase RimI-like enzyme
MGTPVIEKRWIELSNSPAIPRLKFRGFRGEVDYAVMLDLINAAKEADQNERTDTVEDIALAYAYLTNCDPHQDLLFAEVDSEAVAYSRVQWDLETEGDYLYTLFGIVHPDWRRRGIGRAMLHYNQRRLASIARELDHKGTRLYQSFASETEQGTEALLLGEGYQATRHFFEMVRKPISDVHVLPMPEGLELREVETDHIRTIWEARDEAFRDHWGHVPETEERYQQWLQLPTFDPSLWKVAWEGDEVAGMVLNFVNRPENEEYNRLRGWTEDVSVRRPWRRCGLASSLISQSIAMFGDMGMEETALGVDTSNRTGALSLYKKLGYRQHKRFTYRKPMNEDG